MQKFPRLDFKKKDSQSAKTDKSIFLKPPFLKVIYLSVLVNFVSIGGIFLLKKHLPPEVPLFYGLAEGEDQLTKSLTLIIAPLVSLTIVLINLILASVISNDFLRKTLVVIGFCVTIFSFVTITQIVLLVGYF